MQACRSTHFSSIGVGALPDRQTYLRRLPKVPLGAGFEGRRQRKPLQRSRITAGEHLRIGLKIRETGSCSNRYPSQQIIAQQSFSSLLSQTLHAGSGRVTRSSCFSRPRQCQPQRAKYSLRDLCHRNRCSCKGWSMQVDNCPRSHCCSSQTAPRLQLRGRN